MVTNHDNMLLTFDTCNMKYLEGMLLFPQFELLHSTVNRGDRSLIRSDEMNLNIGMALKWIPSKNRKHRIMSC